MTQVKIVDHNKIRTPEVDAIAEKIVDTLRYCAGKAMAHILDERAYPLPNDPLAVERIHRRCLD